MRHLLAFGLVLAVGCGATQSSHLRASGSTGGGSASGTTTSGVGVAPLCTDCSGDAQCASGFCDAYDTQGHGFCDVAQPCQSDDACDGYASCNAAFGNCECPQLGGATSSASSSGSTGTTSSGTTSSGTTTSGSTGGGGACTSCASTSQCGTGHCLKETGGTNYYCGADCTADASICPSGWTCDALSSGKSGCRSVAPACP